MQRRALMAFTASTLIASSLAPPRGAEAGSGGDLDSATAAFGALPGIKSYLVHVGAGGSLGTIALEPDQVMFTASAFKTFVLGAYLRAVEAGRLSETAEVAIDDTVRMLGSPAFIDLAGKTQARIVLEEMIAHSDNTATDAAMQQVGADQVRALVAQAGLRAILIPNSTRSFTSYVLGAPAGGDFGWPGILEAAQNPPGPVRPLLNTVESLAGSATDFVSWYEQSLRGDVFAKPETLVEFKRIQAMSEQIVKAVPAETPAYAKGGEVADFEGFNAKSFAGQMVVSGTTPVTFCFVVNWQGPSSEFAEIEAAFFAAILELLTATKQALGSA